MITSNFEEEIAILGSRLRSPYFGGDPFQVFGEFLVARFNVSFVVFSTADNGDHPVGITRDDWQRLISSSDERPLFEIRSSYRGQKVGTLKFYIVVEENCRDLSAKCFARAGTEREFSDTDKTKLEQVLRRILPELQTPRPFAASNLEVGEFPLGDRFYLKEFLNRSWQALDLKKEGASGVNEYLGFMQLDVNQKDKEILKYLYVDRNTYKFAGYGRQVFTELENQNGGINFANLLERILSDSGADRNVLRAELNTFIEDWKKKEFKSDFPQDSLERMLRMLLGRFEQDTRVGFAHHFMDAGTVHSIKSVRGWEAVHTELETIHEYKLLRTVEACFGLPYGNLADKTADAYIVVQPLRIRGQQSGFVYVYGTYDSRHTDLSKIDDRVSHLKWNFYIVAQELAQVVDLLLENRYLSEIGRLLIKQDEKATYRHLLKRVLRATDAKRTENYVQNRVMFKKDEGKVAWYIHNFEEAWEVTVSDPVEFLERSFWLTFQKLDYFWNLISVVKDVTSRVRKHAVVSAIAAIMGRNMSHNIGSHAIWHMVNGLKTYDDQSIGEFLTYLQKRMDFIAQVSTSGPGWSLTIRWQEVIVTFARQACLLDNIVKSYRTTYLTGRNDQDTKLELEASGAANVMADIPHGEIGCHAFYSIMENLIRNSAKYGVRSSIPKLRFIVKAEENWDDGGKGWNREFYRISIRDSLMSTKRTVDYLNKTLAEPLLDLSTNELKPGAWGMKEIKICAAYLRMVRPEQIDEKYENWATGETNEPPLISVCLTSEEWQEVDEVGYLTYMFYLDLPKNALVVGGDETLNQNF